MRLSRFLAPPVVAMVLVTGACERGLTDLNENPNEPETVPPQNVLAWAMMQGVGGSYGTNGIWSGLYLLNLWAQHLAAPTYITEDTYTPRDSQVTDIWEVTFVRSLKDLDAVKEMAEAAGDGDLFAVAEIFTQYLFQYLTDIYGDIPYSQALQAPEITAPAYDAQQEVYKGMLAALEAVMGRIDRGTTGAFAAGDLIYEGDMERWYRFGNSLRMRMAMRISDVAPELAREHFQAAHALGGFESNADNARLVWGPSPPSQNPRHDQFFNQNRRDQVVSAALVERLQAWDDPRLPVFADPAPADGVFRGIPNGVTPGELDLLEQQISPPGSRFLEATAPSVIMNYAEVLFLKAEAAERGWIGGDPATLYRDAVRASMAEHGIGEEAITAYLARADVQYDGLPILWTQKWVALYLVGTEGWAEVRRTGYPQLTPAAGAQIPSRLFYPIEESLYNPQNYQETTLFTPMWWQGN